MEDKVISLGSVVVKVHEAGGQNHLTFHEGYQVFEGDGQVAVVPAQNIVVSGEQVDKLKDFLNAIPKPDLNEMPF